jgi:hypothetical protein
VRTTVLGLPNSGALFYHKKVKKNCQRGGGINARRKKERKNK